MSRTMIGRTIFFSVLLLFSLTGAGQAGESWVTDSKTGAQVGWIHDNYTMTAASWSGPIVDGKAEGKGILLATLKAIDNKEYKGQIQAEMVGGKLDGKVSLKLSDGDTFEGTCVKGVAEGKGIYRFADRSRIYEGEYKNNRPDGYGVYKDFSGKVVYEGQWVEGNPATRPVLDKVLGVAWRNSEDEVKKVMLARPKTALRDTVKNGSITEQQYWGPFNDQEQWIMFRFFEGKMYIVGVVQQFGEDRLDLLMERFDASKKGLNERYGHPDIENGKYLDAKLAWTWYGKYAVVMSAERMTTTNPPSFILRLVYMDVPIYYKVEGKATSNQSDF